MYLTNPTSHWKSFGLLPETITSLFKSEPFMIWSTVNRDFFSNSPTGTFQNSQKNRRLRRACKFPLAKTP
eukprot:UN14358